MKKSLTALQLQIISWNSGILRACNGVPFPIANKINGNGIAAQALLKTHNDNIELLKERRDTASAIVDEPAREAALAICTTDENDLANAVYDIELNVFSPADFENLDISGEKDYQVQDGSVIKLSYREAFFFMEEFIIAA
jgi:hypothetical protein